MGKMIEKPNKSIQAVHYLYQRDVIGQKELDTMYGL